MGRCAHRPCCLRFVLVRVRLTKPPQIAGFEGWGHAAPRGERSGCGRPGLRRLVQVSRGWPRVWGVSDPRAPAGCGRAQMRERASGGRPRTRRKNRRFRPPGNAEDRPLVRNSILAKPAGQKFHFGAAFRGRREACGPLLHVEAAGRDLQNPRWRLPLYSNIRRRSRARLRQSGIFDHGAAPKWNF